MHELSHQEETVITFNMGRNGWLGPIYAFKWMCNVHDASYIIYYTNQVSFFGIVKKEILICSTVETSS